MILIQFGGGLGNQMFQYAYLYSQIKNNAISGNDISAFMHRNHIEDRRNFALSNFNISLDLGYIIDEDNLDLFTKSLVKCKILTRKCINRVIQDKDIKSGIMSSLGICSISELYDYREGLRINRKNVFVEGAFQNWKYFNKYSEDIKKEFEINTEPSETNKEMIRKIKDSNSVCVHIRRGDFLNSSYAKDLAICNYDYYAEGINRIIQKVNDPVFYIFSNTHEDIEWIKNNYRFEGTIIYVDLNNPDYEELRLMMNCKHFIISNSTYSWWAQYLSSNDNKIVIAPSKWIKDTNIDASGIYLPTWELVEV